MSDGRYCIKCNQRYDEYYFRKNGDTCLKCRETENKRKLDRKILTILTDAHNFIWDAKKYYGYIGADSFLGELKKEIEKMQRNL